MFSFLVTVVSVFSLVACAGGPPSSTSSSSSPSPSPSSPFPNALSEFITIETLGAGYSSITSTIYRVRGIYDPIRQLVLVEGNAGINGSITLIQQQQDGTVRILPVRVDLVSRFYPDPQGNQVPPTSEDLYLLGCFVSEIQFKRFLRSNLYNPNSSARLARFISSSAASSPNHSGIPRELALMIAEFIPRTEQRYLDLIVADFPEYIRTQCHSHDLTVFREKRLKAVGVLIFLFDVLRRYNTDYPFWEYHLIPDNVYGWITYALALLFASLICVEIKKDN